MVKLLHVYRKTVMTTGSGAIESVNKWVTKARCKQAGMAWSEVGVSAIAPRLRLGLGALG